MKLNRANLASRGDNRAKAPERIVHVGVGAFSKAHQVWFTQKVDSQNEWGVVAFTGRSALMAEQLNAQDGLYSLVERSNEGDTIEIIDRVVRAEDGNDTAEFIRTLSNPEIALVTMTITEAGYGFTKDGKIDAENPAPAISRVAFALDMRRRISGAPITLVPCDNIPNNGELLRQAIETIFQNFEVEAQTWLEQNVSFVCTSVDRITPQTLATDVDEVEEVTGWQDSAATITEPFRDWVLAGEFLNGRPNWELAGAKFVKEIEPFENRKLWLLNGAHSILAYLGSVLGHTTVAEAIADSRCKLAVENFWNDACAELPVDGLDLPEYREALLARFSNSRIAHQLSQIANDGSTKLAVRIAPVAKARLRAGLSADNEALAIAAWITFISNFEFQDAQREAIKVAQRAADSVNALVATIDKDLAGDEAFVAQVKEHQVTLIF